MTSIFIPYIVPGREHNTTPHGEAMTLLEVIILQCERLEAKLSHTVYFFRMAYILVLCIDVITVIAGIIWFGPGSGKHIHIRATVLDLNAGLRILVHFLMVFLISNEQARMPSITTAYHQGNINVTRAGAGRTACSICKENDPNAIFKPCNHVIACLKCADSHMRASIGTVMCPACRHVVSDIEQVFL